MFYPGSLKKRSLMNTQTRHLKALLVLIPGLLCFPGHAQESWIAGVVVRVTDGDGLVIQTASREKLKIRLSDIDAPEIKHGRNRPGQPLGPESKAAMSDLALGKQVQAQCHDTHKDRYVCTVWAGKTNLANAQLRSGLAMANRVSKRFVRSPETYGIEAQAQSSGVGVWALPADQRIPPWQWRRQCWSNGQC